MKLNRTKRNGKSSIFLLWKKVDLQTEKSIASVDFVELRKVHSEMNLSPIHYSVSTSGEAHSLHVEISSASYAHIYFIIMKGALFLFIYLYIFFIRPFALPRIKHKTRQLVFFARPVTNCTRDKRKTRRNYKHTIHCKLSFETYTRF